MENTYEIALEGVLAYEESVIDIYNNIARSGYINTDYAEYGE